MQHNTDGEQNTYVYKGKVTHRSWPQLPEEIVRLITTHYLWDISGTNYCPQSLETRKSWYSRLVYTCIRDTQDLEKNLLPICPEWRRAIEKHPFWNQAIHVLDPNDSLIFHMTIHPKPQLNGSSNTNLGPIHLTPYQHLRNILNSSCLVCRVNNPLSNNGLTAAKKYATTITLGLITVCREHNHRRGIFCGACLRDEPVLDRMIREDLIHSPAVLENEDDDTWPHIEATCRRCRTEWLWRKACTSGFPHDREAIGGPTLQSTDWETRQNVDGFIELAEGNIADVLTLAREKWWLRMNTKYDSLAQHLLAAQRTQQRHEPQEEEEEDSEEDRELMLMRGAGQVKDLALQDWARHRILDGHWLSPADVWYSLSVPGQPLVVPTVHPCPWSREMDGMDTSSGSGGEEESHPLRATVVGEVPPSFALCEAAYGAHMKQFREIVGPAMRNIVRKIVMESSVLTENGYGDPAQIARKMSLDTVVKILREEEGVWFDGVDWIEKKRNEEEASRRRRMDIESESSSSSSGGADEQHKVVKEDDYDSTSSTGSHTSGPSSESSTHGSSSSNATSPVLSTSTVQTTPSPCPLGDDMSSSSSTLGRGVDVEPHGRTQGLVMQVDPVRSTPRLLSKVPYVPTTIEHLPQYSMEAIRGAWREAIAPLYQCRCRICERTRLAEMANNPNNHNANNAPTSGPGYTGTYPPAPPPTSSPLISVIAPQQPALTKSVVPRPSFVPHVNNNNNADTRNIHVIGDVEGDGEVDYDQSDFEDEEDEEDDEEEEEEEDLDDEDGDGDGDDEEDEGLRVGVGEIDAGQRPLDLYFENVDGDGDGDGDGDDTVLYPQHSPLSETEKVTITQTYRSHNPKHTTTHTGTGTHTSDDDDLQPGFETKPERKQDDGPKKTLKRSSDELEDTSEDVPLALPLPLPGASASPSPQVHISLQQQQQQRDKRGSISPASSPTSRQHQQYLDKRDQEGIPAKRARIGDLEKFPAGDGVEDVNPFAGPGAITATAGVSPTSIPPTTTTASPAATAAATPTADVPPPPANVHTGTVRQRKRSNEELELDLDSGVLEDRERSGPKNKRARVEHRDRDRESAPSPPSFPLTLPLSTSPVSVGQEEEVGVVGDGNGTATTTVNVKKVAVPLEVRGMCQSDMDTLIPMDDLDES